MQFPWQKQLLVTDLSWALSHNLVWIAVSVLRRLGVFRLLFGASSALPMCVPLVPHIHVSHRLLAFNIEPI